MSFTGGVLAAVGLGLTVGCQSYTIVQRNVFADEDGNLVIVDYGRSDDYHCNTFVSPATGREMEFKSKLVVKVQLPDGDTIKAWQCMNFLRHGTMYRTDNEEWMVLAGGFTCIIYQREEFGDEVRYREVFRGVHCDSPEIEVEKNDNWRKIGNPEKDTRMRINHESSR